MDMATKKIKRETARMAEAFEYYYLLGDDRSTLKVSQQFHVNHRTVQYWADSFGWPERVAQRDIEIAQELQRKTLKDIVDTKANYRKIIKIAVKNLVDNLTEQDEEGNPKIKVTSIADLEKLVKLDMLLMGEYTEVTKTKAETVNQTALSPADRAALKDVVDAIVKDITLSVNSKEDDENEQDGQGVLN